MKNVQNLIAKDQDGLIVFGIPFLGTKKINVDN